MTDDQRFISADGGPIDRLHVGGGQPTRADGFNGARLVMAMIDDDTEEFERIVSGFPALQLLSGVAAVALALGEQAADGDTDKLRRILDFLALSPTLDAAGTGEAYRRRRTS